MRFLASLSIAVGCLFAVPNVALAVTYTVDSTLDEADATPGVGGCLTAGAKCTLRAAIEESNASTSVKDTIDFTAAFDGQLADTIAITLGGFPSIADEVTIDGDKGSPCTTAALLAGPCVGVSGSAGLDVNSDDVEIKGLAVIEAGTGINVINSSSGFTATNNWIGVKLDGSAGANTTGIFIDPDSNGASIGGMLPADRNVIANSSNEGLDIEGADDAVVRGNYFGVKPDGVTAAANGKNIEVTDSTAGGGFEATDNQIGATMEGEAQETAACDGGCNVIAGGGLSTGIDLDGESGGNEAPATRADDRARQLRRPGRQRDDGRGQRRLRHPRRGCRRSDDRRSDERRRKLHRRGHIRDLPRKRRRLRSRWQRDRLRSHRRRCHSAGDGGVHLCL